MRLLDSDDGDSVSSLLHTAGLRCPLCPACLQTQVELLHGLMLGRMEDDACVLATTATAVRLLAQPTARAALLAHPEVAARFAELLHHRSREVGGRARVGGRGWAGEGGLGRRHSPPLWQHASTSAAHAVP